MRLHRWLFAAVVMGSAVLAPAEAQFVQEIWHRRYPSSAEAGLDDRILAAAFAGGHLYAVGLRKTAGAGTACGIVKYDAGGAIAADATFPATQGQRGSFNPRAATVADHPGHGVRLYIAGEVRGRAGKVDCVTVALDADLRVLWTTLYDHGAGSGFSGDDIPVAIAADGSRVAVAVTSFGSATGADIATVVYRAADGASASPAKALRFEGLSGDRCVGVALAGNTVYTTGSTWVQGQSYDIVTLAWDATTGAIITGWPRLFAAAPGFSEEAMGICVGANGAIYVGGQVIGGGAQGSIWDYVMLRYSPSGDLLWHDEYAHPNVDMPRAMACARRHAGDGDGEDFVYITGDSGTLPLGAPKGFMTIQYRDLGTGFERTWVAVTDAEAVSIRGSVKALATRDGVGGAPAEVFLTGWAAEPTPNAKTLKYTSDAPGAGRKEPAWMASYDGPDGLADCGWALALALIKGRLNVFVGGASEGAGTASDFLAIRYREIP